MNIETMRKTLRQQRVNQMQLVARKMRNLGTWAPSFQDGVANEIVVSVEGELEEALKALRDIRTTTAQIETLVPLDGEPGSGREEA